MLKEYLSSLANTFRSVLGTTEKINAQDFSSKINEVYEKGKSEGGGGGDTETAYNNGFEAGKQAEYDRFWDSYQQNGERTDYTYAFAQAGWNDETFSPKHNMTMLKATWAFMYSGITDLKGILERQGVIIDTSQTETFNQFCFGSSITHLPLLDVSNATKFDQAFRNSNQLVSMGLENIPETATFTLAFNGVNSLTEFYCSGTIGNDISFISSGLLTHDSLMNIINHLGTVTTTRTLTLHADSKAKLTDAEIAIATEKGWTIA